LKHVLIANRGEIAIRIARAAADLGLATTSVHSEDDRHSLHLRATDHAVSLTGRGAAAYLDLEQILRAALEAGCDAVHPGYGFLSENEQFARRCRDAGLVFVGPSVEALSLFGDKVRAREFARSLQVPLLPGTRGPTSLDDARAFFRELDGAAMMIKAVAGGGGRGMRVVRREADLDEAYARCQSEALSSFGQAGVYVERLIEQARHVEVQIVGDGRDVVHLWERECTLQRRHQKIVEIAPSPTLTPVLREQILGAAVRMAREARYASLGTFEFLVDAGTGTSGQPPLFAFMEANPRVQVEHTITEEVTGIDLVRTQLQIAGGATLADLGLQAQADIPAPRGYAVQLRINMEVVQPDGSAKPTGGTLRAFEPPSGPGIRVDTFGYAGYTTVPNFDSLLAKLVVHVRSPRYQDVAQKAYRALSEFRIDGVATTIPFLQTLLQRPEFAANDFTTRFVELHAAELVSADAAQHRKRYFEKPADAAGVTSDVDLGAPAPAGTVPLSAPMQGMVLSIDVVEGSPVRRGQTVVVIEAMKMQHLVTAPQDGIVRGVNVPTGATVNEGQALLYLEPGEAEGDDAAGRLDAADQRVDLDAIRPDLAAVRARHAFTLDEHRPAAVAKRHKLGKRTARENIAQFTDEGSFVEYGALVVAAQRRRRGLDDLIQNTPADGLVAGIGTVNAAQVGPQRARCVVMAYDYTVLAGTQGQMNHKKMDRLLDLCAKWSLPLVLFAEGGGGRPGDTDLESKGMESVTIHSWARLSGQVPMVSIVSGRCFAGNAALAGLCDVIIATQDTNLGMGGPAMIEGGGLGVFKPEEIGPIDVQTRNGVVDIAVADEAQAVETAKQYISYFQGPVQAWDCADQRLLRTLIPENRLRAYDVRKVIEALADAGSVLELRRHFGAGILTCLVRIEGRPFGLLANNPHHLGGAIDAEAGDKASRFMQLCDAFGLPLINLCDTPGFMVGPEVEKTAQVRRASRMFVVGANCSVPIFTVILRKAVGLGSMAMAASSFHAPVFSVAWPTGEVSFMGLEGSIRLAYKKEMEAIADPVERKAWFDRKVAAEFESGKAVNAASHFQIDAVIDPAETRHWLVRALDAVAAPTRDVGVKRQPFVSVW
jgi:acetyl/propionyl-CoA carboxylase alpha subunit/acetyl-CoA carboxylase carboxyltransferase component